MTLLTMIGGWVSHKTTHYCSPPQYFLPGEVTGEEDENDGDEDGGHADVAPGQLLLPLPPPPPLQPPRHSAAATLRLLLLLLTRCGLHVGLCRDLAVALLVLLPVVVGRLAEKGRIVGIIGCFLLPTLQIEGLSWVLVTSCSCSVHPAQRRVSK